MSRLYYQDMKIFSEQFDEELDVEVSYYFYPGVMESYDEPRSPPEVEVMDVTEDGESIMTQLSFEDIQWIEGDIVLNYIDMDTLSKYH